MLKQVPILTFMLKIMKKYPKFKVGDYLYISRNANVFEMCYTLNWSDEVFVIKKVENTVPWAYNISDVNGEEVFGMFY